MYDSWARTLEAAADRIRAGEPWHEVLEDYGLVLRDDAQAKLSDLAEQCFGASEEIQRLGEERERAKRERDEAEQLLFELVTYCDVPKHLEARVEAIMEAPARPRVPANVARGGGDE